MSKQFNYIFPILIYLNLFQFSFGAKSQYPIGEPGTYVRYFIENKNLPKSVVKQFDITIGAVKNHNDNEYQWLKMVCKKNNNQSNFTWILSSEYPISSRKVAQKNMSRYIIQKGKSKAIEFSDKNRENPILPTTGAWEYLFLRSPHSENPFAAKNERVILLGHEYILKLSTHNQKVTLPKSIHQIELTPDLIICVPHNQKIKDETRRWDETDLAGRSKVVWKNLKIRG